MVKTNYMINKKVNIRARNNKDNMYTRNSDKYTNSKKVSPADRPIIVFIKY